MEIAKLILEYVSILAYPSVIVFALLLFRRQIEMLLQGNLKAQYKDLIITLERNQKALEVIQTNQVTVARNIEAEVKQIETSVPAQSVVLHAQNIRRQLGTLEKRFGDWETEIIQQLRNQNGNKRAYAIFEEVADGSDVWNVDKRCDKAKAAYKNLISSGIVEERDGVAYLSNDLL